MRFREDILTDAHRGATTMLDIECLTLEVLLDLRDAAWLILNHLETPRPQPPADYIPLPPIDADDAQFARREP